MKQYTYLLLLLCMVFITWGCDEEKDFTSSITPEDIALNMVPVKGSGYMKSFSMGKYEVTQDEWMAVMDHNPSRVIGNPNRPVDSASPAEIEEFINRLNQLTGKKYRLPTELEWQYAAAGGNEKQDYSGSNTLDQVGWYQENSGGKPHPVGEKSPNGYGLYDMSGNVMELTIQHTYCGGSWNSMAEQCKSYSLIEQDFSTRVPVTGFRLMLDEYNGPEDEDKEFRVVDTHVMKDTEKNTYYIQTFISVTTAMDKELINLLKKDAKIRFEICPDLSFDTGNTTVIYGFYWGDTGLHADLPADFKEGNYYLRILIENYRSNTVEFSHSTTKLFVPKNLNWDYDEKGLIYLHVDYPVGGDTLLMVDKVKPTLEITSDPAFKMDISSITGTIDSHKRLIFYLPEGFNPGTYYIRISISSYRTNIITWVFDLNAKYKTFEVEGLAWDYDAKDLVYLHSDYPSDNEVGTLLGNGTKPIFELCPDVNFTKEVISVTGNVRKDNLLMATLFDGCKAGTYYVRITIGLYRTAPVKLLIQCDQDRIFSIKDIVVKNNPNNVLSVYTSYPTEFGVIDLLGNIPLTFQLSKDSKMLTGVTKITGTATKPNLITALPENITSGTYYLCITIGRYRTEISEFSISIDNSFEPKNMDWDFNNSDRPYLHINYPSDPDILSIIDKVDVTLDITTDPDFKKDIISLPGALTYPRTQIKFYLPDNFKPGTYYLRITIGKYITKIITWVFDLDAKYKQFEVTGLAWDYDAKNLPYLHTDYPDDNAVGTLLSNGTKPVFEICPDANFTKDVISRTGAVNNKNKLVTSLPDGFKAGTYYIRIAIGTYRTAPMKLLIQCDTYKTFTVTGLTVKKNANNALSLYTGYPTEFGVLSLLESNTPPVFEISKDSKMNTVITKMIGTATKPNLIAALPADITSGTYYVRIYVGRYQTAIMPLEINLDNFYTTFTLNGVDWDYNSSFRMIIKTTGYPQDANVQAALSKGEFPVFELSKDAQFGTAQNIIRYDGSDMNKSYLYAELGGTFDPAEWYVRVVIGNYRSNVMRLAIGYKELTVDPVTFKYSNNSTLAVTYEMPRYLELFQNYGYAKLYTSNQANAQPYKTLAGKNGANNLFTFTDVAPGQYYLRFELGLYRSAFIPVTAEAADLPSFLDFVVAGISPTQMFAYAYIKQGAARIVRQGFCYYTVIGTPDVTAPTVEASMSDNRMSAIIESPYFTPAENTFRAFLETENGDIIYSEILHPLKASKITARIIMDEVSMTDAQYSPGGFTGSNGNKYDYQYEISAYISLFGSINVAEWGLQNRYTENGEWVTVRSLDPQDGHFILTYGLLSNSPDLTSIKTRLYAKLVTGEYIYSQDKTFNIQYTKSHAVNTKANNAQEFSIINIKHLSK